MSRLLKSLNATHKGPYHFCMNCVNNYRTASLRDKHHKHCSCNGQIRVKMPSEKYQFKVTFMLYASFESIFPVNIPTLFQRWLLVDIMPRRRTTSDPCWTNVEYVNVGIYNVEQRWINAICINIDLNNVRQLRSNVWPVEK